MGGCFGSDRDSEWNVHVSLKVGDGDVSNREEIFKLTARGGSGGDVEWKRL